MDKVQRGLNAQSLLENPLFKECLDTLDGIYTQAWRDAKTADRREDCHRYVQLITLLVTDIQSIANTGKLEEARIHELEGAKKGLPSWLKIA